MIPKPLVDHVREGQVVLFLGSGASMGAIHPQKSSPPIGSTLARLIAEKFLSPDFADRPLAQVAELAISETDLYRVQEFVAGIFTHFYPADFHLLIPGFVWSAIATTNYDLIIERAYTQVTTRLQQPVTFKKNGERIEERLKDPNSVMYLKLHGCITDINDHQIPLILTPDQYMQHRMGRSRLFDRLKSFAYEFPLLLVGHSLSDIDIRSILLEINELGDAKPRSYLVAPNMTAIEARYWEGRKISCIHMAFKDFLFELDDLIPKPFRALSKTLDKTDHPLISRFCVSSSSKVSPSLTTLITRDTEYIDKSYKAIGVDAQAFYKGYFLDLSPIIYAFDVRRSMTDNILSEVFLASDEERQQRQDFHLIKGHAGSGKTVLMKRLAWEASTIYDKLCLFVKPSAHPEYEPLTELYRLCNERIFLFFDPATEYVDVIEYFILNAHKDKLPLTIICAERNNEWNTYCADRLEPHVTETYEVRYLNEKEIENLIHLLTTHKSLGHLEGMSFEEQKHELVKKAGRQLLVALHEATLGKPFEEIVLDEYRSITSRRAQALYLTVCILHRLGVETRAGLISRVHGIPFHMFKEELFMPLEFVVFATMNSLIKDYVYRSRHAQIAEIVFEKGLSEPQDRYDEYVRLLNALDVDYSSDREAFKGLTNAKQLLVLFPDLHMIRQIYEIAGKRVPNDAILVQQEAIFEMSSPDKNFAKAADLLHKAQKIEPHNKAIAHSLSVLAIRKSAKAQTPLEKKKLRDEAKSIAIDLTSSGWISEHPYHTLINIGLDELREVISQGDETIIEKQIKLVEDTIATATQLFPDNDFLLESESEFCNMISKSDRAFSALRKAFAANKRNPFIASRLSRMYETAGEKVKAIEVLEECVEANPSDKYINFQLARLFSGDPTSNKNKIRHHLRKSFTEGDSNYNAQFWFARFIYLEGNIGDAVPLFRRLSEAKLDSRIKSKPRGKVIDEVGIVRYTGTIQRMEASYAFIRRDGYNDRIFAYHENSAPDEWRELRTQYRVSFELAFSYRGAAALDVRIEGSPMVS